ncbi:MAG: HU family DNA-binding protein [Bryobacteraceae bacterium]
MTKQQLIDSVVAGSGHPRKDTEAIVESVLAELGKALKSGERVDLRGFGSFVVNDKKARQGRNPKTGETIQIAARKAAAFKPSKELTANLNAGKLETSA